MAHKVVAPLITDLKAKGRVWAFYREELWFQHMWNNRNDFAIRQQFTADFRMIPDTFSDIVTLVRNRLEKQDTPFLEAVPIEKRVAIALWCLATGNSYQCFKNICCTKIDCGKHYIKLWRRN